MGLLEQWMSSSSDLTSPAELSPWKESLLQLNFEATHWFLFSYGSSRRHVLSLEICLVHTAWHPQPINNLRYIFFLESLQFLLYCLLLWFTLLCHKDSSSPLNFKNKLQASNSVSLGLNRVEMSQDFALH